MFECVAAGQRMSAFEDPRFVEGFGRACRSESWWSTFRKGSFSGATAPNGSPGTFATRWWDGIVLDDLFCNAIRTLVKPVGSECPVGAIDRRRAPQPDRRLSASQAGTPCTRARLDRAGAGRARVHYWCASKLRRSPPAGRPPATWMRSPASPTTRSCNRV